MKQEYKAKREKVICPKFCKYADLKCQARHCAAQEVVFSDAVQGTVKMMEQASTIF